MRIESTYTSVGVLRITALWMLRVSVVEYVIAACSAEGDRLSGLVNEI